MGPYFVGPGAYRPLLDIMSCACPAVVVVVNQGDALQAAKRLAPNAFAEYRISDIDFEISGAKAERWLPVLKTRAPSADCFAIANEIMPRDGANKIAAVCVGYTEAMIVAHRLGLKISVGNINTGFPVLTPDNLAAMQTMLDVAAAYGMPLAVHIYNQGQPGPEDCLIWRTLADRSPGLKVLIEEYGVIDNIMPHGFGFARMLALDDYLDDRVIGAAIFALSGTDAWQAAGYIQDIPLLIDHIDHWK